MWKRGALSLRALASQPFFSYPRSQGTYPKVTVFPDYESPVHRRPVHLYDATVRFFQYTGRRQYSTGNKGDDSGHDVSQKKKATGVDDQWDFSAEGDKWDDFDAPVEEPEGLGSKTEDAIDWGSSVIDEGGDWSVQAQADSKDVGEEDWTSRAVDSPWISEDGGSRKPEVQEGDSSVETLRAARMLKLKEEEKHLTSVLEDTNRAFGDLIAQSGITEVQIESLMVMKDLEGIQGLPPLKEIEDARYLKMKKRSVRSELEQKRQEQTAIQRVRKVDQKGRAYGLGKRKCSSAKVWIQPGNGQIIVNKRSFDEYFTALYLRTDILKPFIMTKTLGLWDVVTIARGGGLSGQAGAIRLGISRALQNWEPGFRPYLKAAGLMTRDSRVVERKKPGKAKARKSFQWVKR